MNKNELSKDLITTGIFNAIYIVLFFMSGMIGFIPVLLPVIPFIATLLVGISFMLFVSKINNFGMVTIMGFLMGLMMFATGHTWLCKWN